MKERKCVSCGKAPSDPIPGCIDCDPEAALRSKSAAAKEGVSPATMVSTRRETFASPVLGEIVSYILPSGQSAGQQRPAIVMGAAKICQVMVFGHETDEPMWRQFPTVMSVYSTSRELGTWSRIMTPASPTDRKESRS